MPAITGACHPFTLLEKYLDEPLLLTKDGNGMLHCLSNVCTHRGNLLVYKNCTSSNLRCGYHGRLFDLDRKFRSMPEFKEVKDFPTADDDLTSFRCSNGKSYCLPACSLSLMQPCSLLT
jgi:choline monooxygenase